MHVLWHSHAVHIAQAFKGWQCSDASQYAFEDVSEMFIGYAWISSRAVVQMWTVRFGRPAHGHYTAYRSRMITQKCLFIHSPRTLQNIGT